MHKWFKLNFNLHKSSDLGGWSMRRILFSELHPLTYRISVFRLRQLRKFKDSFSNQKFSSSKQTTILPYRIYRHNSLIRRKLGNVDLRLQDNKAINLALAAPHINRILIRPNETFSFWNLVGRCTAKRGYKVGLTIKSGTTSEDVGGGMCQFTNLIHWLVLHTDLEIIEHHHHDGLDLFPDYGRQIPFGTGTSIFYNYLDYRFKNNSNHSYQLMVHVSDKYLHGEIYSDFNFGHRYHIDVENEHFIKENGIVYRKGQVMRSKVDKHSGKTLEKSLIKTNHAKVMYDSSHLEIIEVDAWSYSALLVMYA